MPRRQPHNKHHQSRLSRFNKRLWLVKGLIGCCFLLIIGRLIALSVSEADFLKAQSQARTIRTIELPAHRGMITDRNGEPLAVSSTVMSVWANPQLVHANDHELTELARRLGVQPHHVKQRLKNANPHRQFVWLRRGMPPQMAYRIQKLHLTGVFLKKEFRRFYPQGPMAAQILGFTDIDQKGQEGIELEFNDWLSGVPGRQKVVKDQRGHVIAPLTTLKQPREGGTLQLSLDYRLQYMAYDQLKQGLKKYQAESGSVVILNPKTGEILAMANAPSFNPNNRDKHWDIRFRNRAMTDRYEPGSTFKALAVLAALEKGSYNADTMIDTNPGRLRIDGHTVMDEHLNHGRITVAQVLQKSSNVGISKIMLQLGAPPVLNLLQRMGLDQRSATGFPGEIPGAIPMKARWHDFELASLGFGYGLALTPIQLAKSYAIIANHGVKVALTLIKQTEPHKGQPVVDSALADKLTQMLIQVTEPGGTGRRAHVDGYRVAGKTATSQMASAQGYAQHQYNASFVGYVPARDPQLVIAVVLRKPQSRFYFGGLTSAPIFAKIAQSALRVLNIPPTVHEDD